MKIIIFGGNGFIGSHLPYEKLQYRLHPDEYYIHGLLNASKPDIVINCVGYGGRKNIDDCEIEKTKTYTTNTIIPLMLAAQCEQLGIRLIHLGSGCIYFGKNMKDISKGLQRHKEIDVGWSEKDFANPQSFYSQTKNSTDLVLGNIPNCTVLRLRMPISGQPHPRNLLNKLLQFKKVLDEPNSMTFLPDLVNAIDFVIQKNLSGIYNIASPEPLTHSVLLEEYRKYVPNHTYEKITKEQLKELIVAPRSNCILNMSKIINEGFQFMNTQERVRECVREYVENLRK